MTEELLTAANIPSKPARFPDPPEVHAIYFDGKASDGPDIGPASVIAHDSTVELYAPSVEAGTEALARFLTELDARSIRYTTQGWYWISSIQRYQEVVEFAYIKKQ